jgi:hypothetical protein
MQDMVSPVSQLASIRMRQWSIACNASQASEHRQPESPDTDVCAAGLRVPHHYSHARLGVGRAGDSCIELGNAEVVIEASTDSENRLTSAVTS